MIYIIVQRCIVENIAFRSIQIYDGQTCLVAYSDFSPNLGFFKNLPILIRVKDFKKTKKIKHSE